MYYLQLSALVLFPSQTIYFAPNNVFFKDIIAFGY